jgi:hypothetical protein
MVFSISTPIGLNNEKASAITKEFPKASSTRINRFQKLLELTIFADFFIGGIHQFFIFRFKHVLNIMLS